MKYQYNTGCTKGQSDIKKVFSKNKKYFDFETDLLHILFEDSIINKEKTVSKNKKKSTFESEWLYENYYERKVS